MTVKTLAVKCPTCNKQVLMTQAFPFRPFCSERCQLIDLGGWAAETRRIPGPEINTGENENDIWSEEFDKY